MPCSGEQFDEGSQSSLGEVLVLEFRSLGSPSLQCDILDASSGMDYGLDCYDYGGQAYA
jgi:hypothetical protein